MCAHNASGHGIGCQVKRTLYMYIYGTSACKAIESSPPNLSEGGSLRLPMNI